MTVQVTVKVEGLAELQRALLNLPLEVRGKPLNAAVAAGARVVRDKAKENAAAIKRTGTLERNIVIARSRRGTGNGRSEYAVLVKRTKNRYANTAKNRRSGRAGKTYYTYGDAFYWRFIEFGTKHMASRPLLRSAFESKKNEALETIKSRLALAIEKAANKLRFKK